MRLRNLIILVALFCGAFYWAGGKLATTLHGETPSQTSQAPQVSQVSQITDSAASRAKAALGTTGRYARFLNIKEAVAEARKGRPTAPLAEIPLPLQQAILMMEDHRFYQHSGIDPEGILRAMLVNLQSGDVVEGGSTITQQLAKNLFLSQDQTFGRKAEEAALALALERAYSKEELLELYLNSIYFGSGAWGVVDASEHYFNKAPRNLSLAECAMLAGLPNAPSLTSPLEHPEAAKQRRQLVLDTMVKKGLLGPKQAREAGDQPLVP